MIYYPTVSLSTIASLLTLRQQMDATPDYLDNPECPYDEDTRDNLRRIMATKTIEVPVEVPVERIVERKVEVATKAAEGGGQRGPKQKTDGVDVDEIAKEIGEIRTELRQMRIDGKGMQTADKIQIIKTRAQLVEKLLSMAERSTNVKRMNIFMSTTMSIIDDLMDDEKRQEFMKRIQPFADAE